MACTKYYAWTAYISVDKVNIPILEECQLKRECPISNVVVVVHLIPLYGKPLLYNIIMITKKLHNDESNFSVVTTLANGIYSVFTN